MNDAGHWVCRLDSQGTVSHLTYVKSHWDGDSIGGARKMPSSADLTREEAASRLRSLGEHPGVWPWGQAVGKLANPAEIMSLWDVHLNCHKRVSRLDVTDREAKRTQEDEVALKPSVVLTL